MKKAYLVTFTTTIRVVVDVPQGFDPDNCNLVNSEEQEAINSIMNEAVHYISEMPCYYLYGENAEIKEDLECPYKEEFFKEKGI